MHRVNLSFAENGHECEIYDERCYLVDKFIPQNSYFVNIRRALMQAKMISETDKFSLRYLKSQCKIGQEKQKHLSQYPYMIHPFSNFRKYWEFFIWIPIMLLLLIVPLENIIFTHDTLHVNILWWLIIKILLNLCLIIDIVMSFFTGYWDPVGKIVVLKPGLVAMQYLQTYFIPDLLSTLPLDYSQLFHQPSRFVDNILDTILCFKYLILFRIGRMRTYGKRLAQELEISNLTIGYVDISLTFLLYFYWNVFIYIHVVAIFYPKFQTNIHNDDNPLFILVEKFYSAVIRFAKAGYTKVRSKQNIWFVIEPPYAWLINEGVFLLLIVRLYSLYGLSFAQPKYDEMVIQLTEYMENKKFPVYLQQRLLSYYEFRFQKSYFRESEILVSLSGQLRQDVLLHSCDKLVSRVEFFKNAPVGLLIRIVTCLKKEIFLPNDVIIKAGSIGNCMYFIAGGTIAIYLKNGKEICHLEDGDHFGEIALVMSDSSQERTTSVIAVDTCELYRLDRKDFITAIIPYPDLMAKIKQKALRRMEIVDTIDTHERRTSNIIF